MEGTRRPILLSQGWLSEFLEQNSEVTSHLSPAGSHTHIPALFSGFNSSLQGYQGVVNSRAWSSPAGDSNGGLAGYYCTAVNPLGPVTNRIVLRTASLSSCQLWPQMEPGQGFPRADSQEDAAVCALLWCTLRPLPGQVSTLLGGSLKRCLPLYTPPLFALTLPQVEDECDFIVTHEGQSSRGSKWCPKGSLSPCPPLSSPCSRLSPHGSGPLGSLPTPPEVPGRSRETES